MNFTHVLIAIGLNLVLVLVSIRFTMTQQQRRHEPLEMFHNLVDLAVKPWFYEYTRKAEYQ